MSVLTLHVIVSITCRCSLTSCVCSLLPSVPQWSTVFSGLQVWRTAVAMDTSGVKQLVHCSRHIHIVIAVHTLCCVNIRYEPVSCCHFKCRDLVPKCWERNAVCSCRISFDAAQGRKSLTDFLFGRTEI